MRDDTDMATVADVRRLEKKLNKMAEKLKKLGEKLEELDPHYGEGWEARHDRLADAMARGGGR